MSIIVHAVIDLEGVDIETFDAYEATVMPLVAEHGGQVIGRYRTADGKTEVHVIGFANRTGRDGYTNDPRRQAAQPLRIKSGVQMQALEMIALGLDGQPLADPLGKR